LFSAFSAASFYCRKACRHALNLRRKSASWKFERESYHIPLAAHLI
jgi:hypothetical protein